MTEDELRARDHEKEELSHYSRATTDLESYSIRMGELWGIADRTDYDLRQHQDVSKQDLAYFDDEKKEKYLPYVIEAVSGSGPRGSCVPLCGLR